MNRQEYDILFSLMSKKYKNQRELAVRCGYSLGIINRSVKQLKEAGYLDKMCRPTAQAMQLFVNQRPQSAVILAAGYGMRMVPISQECPKAFLEIQGERLIERMIGQLHEMNVQKIYIVVGFQKERFEYLIDKYGVELIVNPEYSQKNNLYSLKLVAQYLGNTYIIPSDIWCRENPFHVSEPYSWYMVSDKLQRESDIYVTRSMELAHVSEGECGNRMVGISFLLHADAKRVRARIQELCSVSLNDDAFWETALYNKESNKRKMIVFPNVVHDEDVIEINTYEQLRQSGSNPDQLKTEAIAVIKEHFNAEECEIKNISVLKKGMTNRSFVFSYGGKKYIMRIPGEGTEQLIDRRAETDVYQIIHSQGICDNVVYMDPENGYKISEYLENARACDINDPEDQKACMKKLRAFHESCLSVEHVFDIFGKIDFYESLWNGEPSAYQDYAQTKQKVVSLKRYIDHCDKKWTLTHIDAVPDNFLFTRGVDGQACIYLIDWEYAGMQDPHVDIAMFCIYAMYNREQIDQVIRFYFPEGCSDEIRIKIYCYIAACGLLWSNWCEYKRQLGVEFGAYSLKQYRFAKEYYQIAVDEMTRKGINLCTL